MLDLGMHCALFLQRVKTVALVSKEIATGKDVTGGPFPPNEHLLG